MDGLKGLKILMQCICIDTVHLIIEEMGFVENKYSII